MNWWRWLSWEPTARKLMSIIRALLDCSMTSFIWMVDAMLGRFFPGWKRTPWNTMVNLVKVWVGLNQPESALFKSKLAEWNYIVTCNPWLWMHSFAQHWSWLNSLCPSARIWFDLALKDNKNNYGGISSGALFLQLTVASAVCRIMKYM